MTRWKVAQHIQRRFWVAYPAAYDSEQPESNMDDDLPRRPLARGFRTWREAMDYADRNARTVEVVLPRRIVLPTNRHVVQKDGLVIEFRRSSSYPQLPPGHVVVEPHERRPLALALLALAEKEEKQA